MKKSNIIILILAVILAGAIFLSTYKKQAQAPTDNPTATTTTSTTTPATTTEPISYVGENAENMIKITSPKPGDTITSPLIVKGEARGGWYFEATFPIVLTDGNGLIIAEGYATAIGDWMTENFVPFEATLTFTKPANAAAYGNRSHLILQRSNASGLPEHDKAAEMIVYFK